jgi:hypothetical protein
MKENVKFWWWGLEDIVAVLNDNTMQLGWNNWFD